MRILVYGLIAALILSSSGYIYATDADDDDTDSTGSAVGGAVMGGLLGAGLGAAIGSASGKAGQGALIGGGIGAVGGTLVGASQAKKAKDASYEEAPPQEVQPAQPSNIKKKVIRKYDDKGNVVSEEEVKN